MECPIKNHAVETGTYRGKASTRECAKEACAWWLSSLDCCSITALAMATYNNKCGCTEQLVDRGSFAQFVAESKESTC